MGPIGLPKPVARGAHGPRRVFVFKCWVFGPAGMPQAGFCIQILGLGPDGMPLGPGPFEDLPGPWGPGPLSANPGLLVAWAWALEELHLAPSRAWA